MQDPKKKDKSVQSGLEIAGHRADENDMDDLVHEETDEEEPYAEGEDVDEYLHDRDGGEA